MDRTDRIALMSRLAISFCSYVGRNPTPKRNQYFVLRLDFSSIDPQGDAAAIIEIVRIYRMLNYYRPTSLSHRRSFSDA
uniref:Uncharacterized protein n=1 Tax=Candidatus Kentrum eta TaxID=2126337 RepID=A0A450V995_9GAMM|nr:MAG: hypothetical protein BECKH772A_GA0070896_1006412 [Candidatus Kentron sp. H]VFJ94732.1 MAG: hypothetical protein BECKH772B_GA0070898_1006612 [Candidatus Kentron sp. H]VFK01340.1 MAG: hypothetical protein BECKH772C_GA0070978_1006311 [Candidatus Kentron sp. H]